MRMLVFGRNGQVARALKDVLGDDQETRFAGRETADLMQPGAGAQAIAAHRPHVVINAAAYTAVDQAESAPDDARRLNTDAPAEIAAACASHGAHLIHMSTDYVFDGADEDNEARLDEAAPVNPLNIYGRTKHDGERAVMDALPGAVILRTSWVFSEYGPNFVKTMLRLARERDGLTIVADQIGGPTDAADIARALLAIAGKKYRGGPGAGLYHFQGAPAVSWAAFAEKIFELADARIKITPIPTSQYPTPARRPLRTVLDCARIERDFGVGQPDWRAGLRRVLDEIKKEEQAS